MKYFGTDGIRLEDIKTLELLTYKLSYALYKLNATKVVIGHDPRPHSKKLKNKLKKALNIMSINTFDCKMVLSSCVSFMAIKNNADYAVMITASHNPSNVNGIKIFNHKGEKLKPSLERQIEKYFNQIFDNNAFKQIKTYAKENSLKKGTAKVLNNEEYLSLLFKHLPNLSGKTVVLDCANGSAKKIAPYIFKKTNANLVVINNHSGKNINKNCGATAPQQLEEKVKQTKADIGFAFDGDSDRCVVVLKDGKALSGDNVLLGIGKGNKFKSVVGTIYSNGAIEKAFEKSGIKFYRSSVGDQAVKRMMNKTKAQFGGERSGHFIFSNILPTGDGILSALIIAGTKNFEKLCHFEKMPSKTINLPTKNKTALIKKLQVLEQKAKKEISDTGRILIRASGTEPAIRILIEHKNENIVQKIADLLIT